MTIAIDIDDTITNSIQAVRYFLKKYGYPNMKKKL